MAITFRKYQELFTGTSRFTANTRMCLERAIGHALFGRKGATVPLRSAVGHATRELRVQGLGDTAILATLGAIVEGAGQACRANRTSLLSGIPLWCSVHTRVLASAEHELSRLNVNLYPERSAVLA